MNEPSWALGNTSNRQLLIFVLIQDSSLKNFPKFEISSAENLWLLSEIAIVDGVKFFLVVNYWFSILNWGICQTSIVSVNLNKLTYIQVLFYMWTPKFLDRSYFVFELTQPTALAASRFGIFLNYIHLQRPSTLIWSWKYKRLRGFHIDNSNFRFYFRAMLVMLIMVSVVIPIVVISISIRIISLLLMIGSGSWARTTMLSPTSIFSSILLHYVYKSQSNYFNSNNVLLIN